MSIQALVIRLAISSVFATPTLPISQQHTRIQHSKHDCSPVVKPLEQQK